MEARNKFLPLPQPVLPNAQVDDPESQDYGNFDFGIDFNDPTTLAQLDGGENSFDAIRDKEKVGDLLQKVREWLRSFFVTTNTQIDHLSLFLGCPEENPTIL